MEATRRTPLYEEHLKLHGHMAPFFGWEMPLWYTSAREEHLAVRSSVGLFDVCHMGQILVEGPKAIAAVDRLVTGNVAGLTDGTALYCPMLHPSGGIVDDLIVYRVNGEKIFICVNAATSEKDFNHMVKSDNTGTKFTNLSDRYGQIAVQGPRAKELMQRYLPKVADALPELFRFTEWTAPEGHYLVSTTGYTGEFGYEIYCPLSVTASIWRRLFELGGDLGLIAAGLSSRDTLRLESKLCLYGQDIDDKTNPVEAGLNWTIHWDKEFIGRDAIVAIDRKNPPKKLVGFEMVDGGIPRHECEIFVGDQRVGVVTSGNRCPKVDKVVGLAYLDSPYYKRGTKVEIDIRGKRKAAQVVKTPFYRRGGEEAGE
jgi:aminomethyltransferase